MSVEQVYRLVLQAAGDNLCVRTNKDGVYQRAASLADDANKNFIKGESHEK
jgi:hypothetical protein